MLVETQGEAAVAVKARIAVALRCEASGSTRPFWQSCRNAPVAKHLLWLRKRSFAAKGRLVIEEF